MKTSAGGALTLNGHKDPQSDFEAPSWPLQRLGFFLRPGRTIAWICHQFSSENRPGTPRYVTILTDLEGHQVIDVLKDRCTAVLRDWLKAHPDIEIIIGDRTSDYRRAVTEAAPKALQVATAVSTFLACWRHGCSPLLSHLLQLPESRGGSI